MATKEFSPGIPLVVVLLLAGGATACSATPADVVTETSQTPLVLPSAPTSVSSSPVSPVSSPTPKQLKTPAATAGTLSVHSLPTVKQLGRGWRYSVDLGNAEDGYLGNGTPAVSRDPAEVVLTAVPLGCRRPHTMVEPRHALEVDYTFRGIKVIMIRANFTSPNQSRSFYAARKANLQACQGHIAVSAEGVLVGKVSEPSAGVLLSDRTPASAPWTELGVRNGPDLVLVAVQTTINGPAMTRPVVRRLTALLHR